MAFNMGMLAYCGLYCEQCSCRVAFAERDPRHIDPLPAKIRESRPNLSDYDCGGCKGRSICPPCGIRDCASAKNLNHCGECADFPCDRLSAFGGDGAPHHAGAVENLRSIREHGIEAWFNELKPALQCHCGKRKSWYRGCPAHP